MKQRIGSLNIHKTEKCLGKLTKPKRGSKLRDLKMKRDIPPQTPMRSK
jgi:hypothetical protein